VTRRGRAKNPVKVTFIHVVFIGFWQGSDSTSWAFIFYDFHARLKIADQKIFSGLTRNVPVFSRDDFFTGRLFYGKTGPDP
jgi:hypothetical protein